MIKDDKDLLKNAMNHCNNGTVYNLLKLFLQAIQTSQRMHDARILSVYIKTLLTCDKYHIMFAPEHLNPLLSKLGVFMDDVKDYLQRYEEKNEADATNEINSYAYQMQYFIQNINMRANIKNTLSKNHLTDDKIAKLCKEDKNFNGFLNFIALLKIKNSDKTLGEMEKEENINNLIKDFIGEINFDFKNINSIQTTLQNNLAHNSFYSKTTLDAICLIIKNKIKNNNLDKIATFIKQVINCSSEETKMSNFKYIMNFVTNHLHNTYLTTRIKYLCSFKKNNYDGKDLSDNLISYIDNVFIEKDTKYNNNGKNKKITSKDLYEYFNQKADDYELNHLLKITNNTKNERIVTDDKKIGKFYPNGVKAGCNKILSYEIFDDAFPIIATDKVRNKLLPENILVDAGFLSRINKKNKKKVQDAHEKFSTLLVREHENISKELFNGIPNLNYKKQQLGKLLTLQKTISVLGFRPSTMPLICANNLFNGSTGFIPKPPYDGTGTMVLPSYKKGEKLQVELDHEDFKKINDLQFRFTSFPGNENPYCWFNTGMRDFFVTNALTIYCYAKWYDRFTHDLEEETKTPMNRYSIFLDKYNQAATGAAHAMLTSITNKQVNDDNFSNDVKSITQYKLLKQRNLSNTNKAQKGGHLKNAIKQELSDVNLILELMFLGKQVIFDNHKFIKEEGVRDFAGFMDSVLDKVKEKVDAECDKNFLESILPCNKPNEPTGIRGKPNEIYVTISDFFNRIFLKQAEKDINIFLNDKNKEFIGDAHLHKLLQNKIPQDIERNMITRLLKCPININQQQSTRTSCVECRCISSFQTDYVTDNCPTIEFLTKVKHEAELQRIYKQKQDNKIDNSPIICALDFISPCPITKDSMWWCNKHNCYANATTYEQKISEAQTGTFKFEHRDINDSAETTTTPQKVYFPVIIKTSSSPERYFIINQIVTLRYDGDIIKTPHFESMVFTKEKMIIKYYNGIVKEVSYSDPQFCEIFNSICLDGTSSLLDDNLKRFTEGFKKSVKYVEIEPEEAKKILNNNTVPYGDVSEDDNSILNVNRKEISFHPAIISILFNINTSEKITKNNINKFISIKEEDHARKAKIEDIHFGKFLKTILNFKQKNFGDFISNEEWQDKIKKFKKSNKKIEWIEISKLFETKKKKDKLKKKDEPIFGLFALGKDKQLKDIFDKGNKIIVIDEKERMFFSYKQTGNKEQVDLMKMNLNGECEPVVQNILVKDNPTNLKETSFFRLNEEAFGDPDARKYFYFKYGQNIFDILKISPLIQDNRKITINKIDNLRLCCFQENIMENKNTLDIWKKQVPALKEKITLQINSSMYNILNRKNKENITKENEKLLGEEYKKVLDKKKEQLGEIKKKISNYDNSNKNCEYRQTKDIYIGIKNQYDNDIKNINNTNKVELKNLNKLEKENRKLTYSLEGEKQKYNIAKNEFEKDIQKLKNQYNKEREELDNVKSQIASLKSQIEDAQKQLAA